MKSDESRCRAMCPLHDALPPLMGEHYLSPVQGQMVLGLHAFLSQSRTSLSRSSCRRGNRASWTEVLCSFSHLISGFDSNDHSTSEV